MKKQKYTDPVYLILFSREMQLERIRLAFSHGFGLPAPMDGNSVKLDNANCNVELVILLSSMGPEEKEFIQKQKNMACGFFTQIEGGNPDIKVNLFHYLRQASAFVLLAITPKHAKVQLSEESNHVAGAILKAMQEIDGVFIDEQGSVARNKDNKIILAEDGTSELESYFPFVLEEHPSLLEDCTPRQKMRRYENMRYLFDRGIYVCELPVNEDDEQISLREKSEVVRRMLGLLVISLYSEAMLNPEDLMSVPEARTFVKQVMADHDIERPEEILTPEELAYFYDDQPAEKTQIDYSWHYEHLYLLEWVLGLTEWEDPTEICDVRLVVRSLKSFGSVEEICEKTTMRAKKEILDKADLLYRMDWAAVDARIHHMTGPAHLDHGVVQARHKTLNWMIRFEDDDWDDVDTPT